MFSGTIPILNITLLLTKSTLSVEIVLISSPNAVYLNYFSYLCGVRAAKRQTDNNRQFKEIIQIMATLVLQIPDESLVSKVKQACKMIVGVASVRRLQPAKKKVYDITKTAGYREAMDDVKHGRVHHADSVDDMFKDILGEDIFNEIRRSNV